MINGKSVVGYRVADVVKLLKEAEPSITIIVASKVLLLILYYNVYYLIIINTVNRRGFDWWNIINISRVNQ